MFGVVCLRAVLFVCCSLCAVCCVPCVFLWFLVWCWLRARCVVFVVYCVSVRVCGLLVAVVCWLRCDVCCSLRIVGLWLLVVCWLFDSCCSLFVVRCVLLVV